MAKSGDLINTVIFLILGVAVVWILIDLSKKENLTGLSGTPPPLGDYLPTTGDTPHGAGDYVDISAEGGPFSERMSPMGLENLNSTLCEECVSHCVNWATRHGIGSGLTSDRVKCKNYCNIECDFGAGL